MAAVVDALRRLALLRAGGYSAQGARRQLRVWALSVGMVALAAGLQLTVVRDLHGLGGPLHIPWLALVILFVAGEWWRVCLYFRSSAHSFSLSEIPLVVGLLLSDPSAL